MFDFTGYGENVLTFKTEDENLKGMPVCVVANDTVAAAGDGAEFCGMAIAVRGGVATVLMSGYVEMPYSGEAPNHGAAYIVANGEGGVKTGDSGNKVNIIKIDTDSSTIGFIF